MQWLRYDPETGHFTWLLSPNGGRCMVKAGSQAGGLKDGYIIIRALDVIWRAHRLAWLFQTGAAPPADKDIDHINGRRDDNRWVNLRLVTRTQNNMNLPPRSDNRSGHRGVSWRESRKPGEGKWHARINIQGRTILLGNFDLLDDAVAARVAAERQHFGAHSFLERSASPCP